MQEAAMKMVREGKNLPQVALELELKLTSRELENVARTKAFQQVLWQERHKYHRELAQDPNVSKNTLVGEMMVAIRRLMDEGEWAKALDGLYKLAQVQGWKGADTQQNIFFGVSDKDLDALERHLKGIDTSSPGRSDRTGQIPN
jgi:hypothetical protein